MLTKVDKELLLKRFVRWTKGSIPSEVNQNVIEKFLAMTSSDMNYENALDFMMWSNHLSEIPEDEFFH